MLGLVLVLVVDDVARDMMAASQAALLLAAFGCNAGRVVIRLTGTGYGVPVSAATVRLRGNVQRKR